MLTVGKTIEGQDIYYLTKNYAVVEDGNIVTVERDGFYDTTLHCPFKIRDNTKHFIINHIVNMRALMVGEYTIDIVKNNIDGTPFEVIDQDGDLPTVVLYKTVQITIRMDGTQDDILTLDETHQDVIKEAKAIIKALDFKVTEYEKII